MAKYTGILCHLTGLCDPEHAAAGPMAGAIMETAVLAEIRTTLANRGVDAPVYFWRTARGVEVDFLVQVADQVVAVEVKKTATPRPPWRGPSRHCRRTSETGPATATSCTRATTGHRWARGSPPPDSR